jgi:nicotinamidase-related amidase
MAVDLASLVEPDRTAVVLVEMQRSVLGDESFLPQLAASARDGGVVDAAAKVAAAARAAGVTVIHATAEDLPGRFGASRNARLFAGAVKRGAANVAGSAAVQPLAELSDDRDLVLPRRHGLSAMTGSELDSVLRNEGITTLVVAGVSLNVAVTNLVFDAVNRSYQVVLVADACAAVPPEYGEAVVENSLALLATVTGSDDLVAAWSVRAVRHAAGGS